jgi:hypothetical protein
MHAAAAAVAFGPVIAWHTIFMLLVLVAFFYGDFILVQKNPLLLPPRYGNKALSRALTGVDHSAAYVRQQHVDRPSSSKLPASAKG